jgi:hypothetical protein
MMNEWQEAAREEPLDYLEVQQALGKNPYNVKDEIMQTLCKKQTGGGTTKTQYWKAKGPDAMEVDTSISSNGAKEEAIFEGNQTHKKLTDEERAALKLLGLCYFCRGGKYPSANCLEKPLQQNPGRDRRALPGKPLVRPPPNKWNKPKVRSTETEGEQTLLTRDYIQKNFQDMVLLLNEEERAEALGKAAQQLLDF